MHFVGGAFGLTPASSGPLEALEYRFHRSFITGLF
jgi:hypothetical protein